jgi:hypothetical protein
MSARRFLLDAGNCVVGVALVLMPPTRNRGGGFARVGMACLLVWVVPRFFQTGGATKRPRWV